MDHVYLDYAATTPVRGEVRAAMDPYLTDTFGNPSSAHRWGREAGQALERAREDLAEAIGAKASEVVFVRGGTESDNLALLGWCAAQRARGDHPTVLISTIEHHAVLDTAEHAAATDLATVEKIAVAADGTIDMDALRGAAVEPTLVSVMWVNNETGMLLPIDVLADAVRDLGAILHSDAAQAVGKVPVDVSEVDVDLLSGTGHKIYAPKGTGFLYVREGTPVAALMHGGGQERSFRPGTEDVAGAVGLAAGVRLATSERDSESARLGALRAHMESRLHDRVPDIRVNGSEAPRAPHVLSVAVGGLDDASLLVTALDLEGIGVSSGSACASGATRATHVLEALYGLDDHHATVRFSFGRGTTEDDIELAVEALAKVVTRLRQA